MTMKEYAPVVLRLAISLVFLWFASQQLMSTEMWTGLIPVSLIETTGFSAANFVHLNAAFEVVFGLTLMAGFFTRVSALLLALHLLSIILNLGYSAVAIRDFGLMLALVAVFLYGADRWSFDYHIKFHKYTGLLAVYWL